MRGSYLRMQAFGWVVQGMEKLGEKAGSGCG